MASPNFKSMMREIPVHHSKDKCRRFPLITRTSSTKQYMVRFQRCGYTNLTRRAQIKVTSQRVASGTANIAYSLAAQRRFSSLGVVIYMTRLIGCLKNALGAAGYRSWPKPRQVAKADITNRSFVPTRKPRGNLIDDVDLRRAQICL